MSGSRLFSFREGDRSEYLAQYLLSGLGLVTPVPRQEDIGFDFVCSIADEELGFLTFNHQYIVSVKSIGDPNVELDPPEKHHEGLPHINWLFRLDLPLFLAVVDKDRSEMALYSTLPIWLLFSMKELGECGALHLIPRVKPENTADVGYPTRGAQIANLPGKFVFKVDLGHPIVRINPATIKERDSLKRTKDFLRDAVCYARVTILHALMGVHHFHWFAKTFADGSRPVIAFIASSIPDVPQAKQRVYQNIAPALASLALMFKATKEAEKLEAVGKLLREAPSAAVPPQLRAKLPEIFPSQ